MIDDQQLLAAKPDVNYKELTSQPSPQDFLVLTRVKGVVSVAQLCAVSGLGREKTLAAIEVLLDVGLLHVVDADGNPVAVPAKPAPKPEPEPEPVAEPEPEPEPVAEPEPEPLLADEDALAPDDETAVMSGVDAVAFALVSDASDSGAMVDDDDDIFAMPPDGAPEPEPESEDPDADIFVPDAEPTVGEGVIAIEAPDAPMLGDFEVDHQPIAGATEEYIVPTRVDDPPAAATDSQPIVIDDFGPEEQPEEEPAQQHTSFETIAPDDDDDDLFEPASPAHIDRVEGRAPIKRDHGRSRVEEEAKSAAAKAKKAPPKVSTVNVANYRLFPVDYAGYESQHGPIEGVDEHSQKEIDFVFDHLEYVDFYQLFGVEESVDRKAIRARYFSMSKQFHPDKFFRDDVGALRERVDAIFRFVTKGYKTLSKKNTRAEYDAALARARAQAVHASADEERKRARAADMLERRAAQLEQQGQLAQAAAEFKKVGTLRRDAHALVKAASLLLRANQQLDEAASLARAAVRELPQEVEPRLVLGQIYEKNQMFAEAAAVFGEAEALAPDNPSVRVHLERVRSQH